MGSFDMIEEDDEPPHYVCTICQRPYHGPLSRCYFCKDEKPGHHGGCCFANPNRRTGHSGQPGRAYWLEKDLMEARKNIIQLKADLDEEKDRTDMFAKEVCELILDKSK